MPKRITDPEAHHVFAANTCMSLTPAEAAHASLRQSLRVKQQVFAVDPLSLYCVLCRRTYDDVADMPCEAAVSNEHLIGGPTGTRKKRIKAVDAETAAAVLLCGVAALTALSNASDMVSGALSFMS